MRGVGKLLASSPQSAKEMAPLLQLQLASGPQAPHHSETEIRLKMGSRRAAGGWDGPNTPASNTGESEPPRLLPLLP